MWVLPATRCGVTRPRRSSPLRPPFLERHAPAPPRKDWPGAPGGLRSSHTHAPPAPLASLLLSPSHTSPSLVSPARLAFTSSSTAASRSLSLHLHLQATRPGCRTRPASQRDISRDVRPVAANRAFTGTASCTAEILIRPSGGCGAHPVTHTLPACLSKSFVGAPRVKLRLPCAALPVPRLCRSSPRRDVSMKHAHETARRRRLAPRDTEPPGSPSAGVRTRRSAVWRRHPDSMGSSFSAEAEQTHGRWRVTCQILRRRCRAAIAHGDGGASSARCRRAVRAPQGRRKPEPSHGPHPRRCELRLGGVHSFATARCAAFTWV